MDGENDFKKRITSDSIETEPVTLHFGKEVDVGCLHQLLRPLIANFLIGNGPRGDVRVENADLRGTAVRCSGDDFSGCRIPNANFEGADRQTSDDACDISGNLAGACGSNLTSVSATSRINVPGRLVSDVL